MESDGAGGATNAPRVGAASSGAVFELSDVTVRYTGAAAGGPPALERVSFAVRAGECVAVVGPNGAGKTTLLRALLGQVPTASGRALALGRDARSWARDALAREVGVVSQREEPAFPLTVREAVEMGRYPHLGAWRAPGSADRAAVERAMRRSDVIALGDRWVETLSGGEWQRVRIARALAQEPRALVLDEPTASLDLSHEMQLFELVQDLVRRDGLAALIVSHHINVAARFADRLVLLAGGRVVADGPGEAVLEPQRLAAVFGWPVAVYRLEDGSVQLYPERQPVKPDSGVVP
ncbi:MAG TPA: ABC transporter ATP-binding protein [Gemmatimonadales bacterium]|nr:ABC transporter ATP-binding protein [Gemmatimonadales bacterium]